MLVHHAKPRYTKDLDVFTGTDPENARRIVTALEEFGFGGLGISAEDFSQPGRIVHVAFGRDKHNDPPDRRRREAGAAEDESSAT